MKVLHRKLHFGREMRRPPLCTRLAECKTGNNTKLLFAFQLLVVAESTRYFGHCITSKVFLPKPHCIVQNNCNVEMSATASQSASFWLQSKQA